jgi:CHAT domain-containing protein/tetratricopeptide (TPR) repeat protein
VVDGEEQPDLLRQVVDGELTPPRCPECDQVAGVREPLSLLVRRPGLRPEILFASTTPADEQRVQSQAQVSAMALNRGGSRPAGGEAILVPYELIAVIAARDVPADADALEGHRFGGFSPELQRYGDWLRGYVENRFKEASQPAVLGLVQADGLTAIVEVIRAHPVLLDERVDALLGHMAELTEQEGQPQMAAVARARRDLLEEVRTHGLDVLTRRAEPPADVRARRADHPDDAARLTPSVGAALVALAGHPIGDGPVTGHDLRRLLEQALADMTSAEAEYALPYGHDELVGLRDVLTLNLAEELIKAPRDRNDNLAAQRLLRGVDHLRGPAPHSWAAALHNAAIVASRLATAGDLDALDLARVGFERALTVRTADADPESWAVTVVAQANLLQQDYPGDDPRYLDESIRMLDAAIAHPGLSARALLSLMSTRASGALRRAERRGDPAALRDAVDSLGAALTLARRSGEDEATRVLLSNLGMALSLTAEGTGRPDDWARAIGTLREALDASAEDRGLQWASAAANLSIALRSSGDVEAAIPLMRGILERTAAGEFWTAWAGAQNNLGTALLDRVEGDRDENVQQAIEAYDSARRVWTREAFPVEWALTTARLANAYERTPTGAEHARDLLAEAVELIPRGERPVAWARLTNMLAGHEPPAVAERRYRAAAEVLTEADHPHEWASIQSNLGNLYSRTAVGERAQEHLAAAASCYRAALDARPASDSPLEWAGTAAALGGVLARRGLRADAVAVLRDALGIVREGAPAPRVVLVASRLGRILAEDGRWREAAAALQEAVDAADRIYATSLLRRSRERTLGANGWVFQALAHCLVQDGKPMEGVQALERGRTRMLGDALARDPERVAQAAAARPDEYRAYVMAVRRLATAEAASTRLTVLDPAERGGEHLLRAEQAVRDELREASAAFESARSRLPEPPAPPPAPADGHVLVYLFSTGVDTMALLVRDDAVQSVNITGVGDGVLRRVVYGDMRHPGLLQAQDRGGRHLRAALATALSLVGPQVMRPVADAVRAAGDRSVTLVPVGLYAAIPLHAAPIDEDGRCLLDRVPVGYAPSATVLHAAQRSARERSGGPRSGIAVVDPGSDLAYTDYEASTMLRWVGGRRVDGGDVEVQDAMVDATHVHFACHGRSFADRPLESHLLLRGGRTLSLLDLLTADRPDLLRRARLVVASACQTAVVDTTHTPDEFVGLATGFLAAGVPCFVGTMWPSEDLACALVMSRFYELTTRDGHPPHEALRRAQLWLRDLDGAGLLAHLESHPDLASVAPNLISLAASAALQRIFADPVSWAPYVVIGAAEPNDWTRDAA